MVDALTLSVVPGDVGKPTARLDKATVRDGSCKWENPVYETVKFVRDAKSGKINEKIYYFLVSMVCIEVLDFSYFCCQLKCTLHMEFNLGIYSCRDGQSPGCLGRFLST